MALLLKKDKSRNSFIDESFIQVINDKYKGIRVTCKYCQKELNKIAFCFQDHLNICKKYQEAAKLGQIPAALYTFITWS